MATKVLHATGWIGQEVTVFICNNCNKMFTFYEAKWDGLPKSYELFHPREDSNDPIFCVFCGKKLKIETS
jgi:NMD protein affecting ribosome stability and mRNA decay